MRFVLPDATLIIYTKYSQVPVNMFLQGVYNSSRVKKVENKQFSLN